MITVPRWFVGVYLTIVLAAPAMMRLHQRHVRWPVLGALAAAVAVVDALRLVTGAPLVGFVNYPFVRLAVHQVGFGYADGTLPRGGRRLAGLLAGGGLAAAVVLVFGTSAYPVLMVGLPGNEASDSAPPTLALLAQSAFLVGVALLLRPAGSALVAWPRVWFAVAAGSGLRPAPRPGTLLRLLRSPSTTQDAIDAWRPGHGQPSNVGTESAAV